MGQHHWSSTVARAVHRLHLRILSNSDLAKVKVQNFASLLKNLPKSDLVWGGDWNHSLIGSKTAGSKGGREHVLGALQKLNLQVPTAGLSHQLGNCNYSIDHIAVPYGWVVKRAARVVAKGLSAHDAYVIEVHQE